MVKLVATLRQPVKPEDFQRWLLEVHAPVGRKMPGLRRYVLSPSVGGVAGVQTYDGIAELWFDSVQDLEKALQSPEGQEAMRDVMSNVKEVSLVITEERVVV